MLPIEPLGLSANQWQFLNAPEKYVNAVGDDDRPLVLESTVRQFSTAREILARLNGSNGKQSCRGILLADDVGLGKTTVAAIVAWIVASAGGKRRVRILAPNDVMVRRWADELKAHVAPMQACARHLGIDTRRVRVGRIRRLNAGSIQVAKHSYASSDSILDCDLLIVDEAHRAKGENTAFSSALKRLKRQARRVLILTATPYSICLGELKRMLSLVNGDAVFGPVQSFSRALDDLYSGNPARDPEQVANRLADKAEAAVAALRQFVIRHGIDDLSDTEKKFFGDRMDWDIEVPRANPVELEIMIRMDRVLRVAKAAGLDLTNSTNDPRFHVGWRYLDLVRTELKHKVRNLKMPQSEIVTGHLQQIQVSREKVTVHSKLDAVGKAASAIVRQGEKVLLFCHHHATAQELTIHLNSTLSRERLSQLPSKAKWRRAWENIIEPCSGGQVARDRRSAYIEWLCADLTRQQTWRWIEAQGKANCDLTESLSTTRARNIRSEESVAAAARRLYHALLGSRSSRAVLKRAADGYATLPGGCGTQVLGVCSASANEEELSLFVQNEQPDTVIAVFNSPFGPDALIVTDKLSEGVDLHRYCRHLIHYELDSSPIRTVQRNGRLRRVNSWASVIGEPICYAYPAFRGTRDHRLVQIMKRRMDNFAILLGGVHDFEVEEVVDSEEAWRNQVVSIVKKRLRNAGRSLLAGDPRQ